MFKGKSKISVKFVLMLPREWKMCIHCVAGKPESDNGVIRCAGPRNIVLSAL